MISLWNIKNGYRFLLLGVLLAISIGGIVGEKIPVNNGTGWDGKHYAHITIHFEELVLAKQIDSYQYQRILTPCIIYYSCKLIQYPLSISNIVFVFSVYNLLLILLSVGIYFNFCSTFKLSIPIEILGFSCLFYNFFILKNTPYYPVLTDVTSFFAGLSLAYFFITNKWIGLLVTTLLGYFIFPLFSISALVLFLNIRHNQLTQKLASIKPFKVFSILLMVLFGLGIGYILVYPHYIHPKYTMQLHKEIVPICIAFVLLYFWRSISVFEINTPLINKSNWNIVLIKLMGISLFIVAIVLFIKQHSIPEEEFTPAVFITNIIQQANRNPLVSLVSHIIYLGPALILIILYYKQFVQTMVSFGDSAIAYFLMLIILAIGSETRQFIHFYPFVIFVLLLTLNQVTLTSKQAYIFVFVSLITSKYWLTINVPTIFSQYDYDNFPDQYYFMNHGPFMSDLSYVLNLLIVMITSLFIYFLVKKTKQASPSSFIKI